MGRSIHVTRFLSMVCVYFLGVVTASVEAADGEQVVKDWELMWEYAPNQLLVKFREEPAVRMEEGISGGQAAEAIPVGGSLQQLNQRFRVRKVEELFPGFIDRQRQISLLEQRNPEQLNEREKRLVQRRQRARTGIVTSSLDRIYLLEMEEGQDIKAALAAYRADPQVEFAELNYLVYEHATPNDPYYSIQWPLRNTARPW